MNEHIEKLLTELEDLSARTVELTAAADTIASQELIARRGVLVEQVTTVMTASSQPFSYTDWNRLMVIHYQGNRIHANLEVARGAIAMSLLESVREQALLECMSGMVNQTPAAQLNERG